MPEKTISPNLRKPLISVFVVHDRETLTPLPAFSFVPTLLSAGRHVAVGQYFLAESERWFVWL